MAYLDSYQRQVALLIRALSFVAQEEVFALKGGTAINLFYRDMPRLSVDIDLTYLPIEDRATSLSTIEAAMLRIASRLERAIPDAKVTPSRLHLENAVTKLVVRTRDAQIKIEITPVLRGSVYPAAAKTVAPSVEEAFGFAEILVVSFADLYAGKIVAALDRQHPRDLFDVRDLLAREGIDDALRNAFLVYVISHPRPIAEILAPTLKPLGDEYRRGFEGMTEEPVTLAELEQARTQIIETMVAGMPEHHRRFLIDFKRGSPDWDEAGIPQAAELPAVKWKQQNLDKLAPERRDALVKALERLLFP